jgi:ribosomal protein L27
MLIITAGSLLVLKNRGSRIFSASALAGALSHTLFSTNKKETNRGIGTRELAN